MTHYLFIAIRSTLRLLANHCIIPPLRIALFRLSGIRIGKRVMINMDTKFIDNWKPGLIEIEDEVSMGPFVSVVAEAMPNESFLMQYGVSRTGRVIIRKGAWLGVGSVLLPGVEIGAGAIVGANAVVTKSVEPFAIVAGVPARKIGDVREQMKRVGEKQPGHEIPMRQRT
jgi:acetyltransferase-like isoleucine patch superfamily enzyme